MHSALQETSELQAASVDQVRPRFSNYYSTYKLPLCDKATLHCAIENEDALAEDNTDVRQAVSTTFIMLVHGD